MAAQAASALQATAIGFAQGAIDAMNIVADNAVAGVANVDLEYMGMAFPGFIGVDLPSRDLPPSVTLPAISAASPVAPVLDPITIPTLSALPDFTMVEPVLAMPLAPSALLPNAPGSAPTFDAVALPDSPLLILPDVPVFAAIALPSAPSLSIPTFDESLPVDEITAPSDVFTYSEAPYESALLDAATAKLMGDLLNGSYGIDVTDENLLWERMRERELRGAEVAIQEATRQAAARGFMIPPGVLNAQINVATDAAREKTSSASRDISIKRADMFVENRKFTIEQVRQYEQMMITYFGYAAERALNVAKAVVELGIAAFQARMAAANYRLERYKVAASVYETLIRAALLNLEAYKAQLEGARITADIQRLHTEVYRSQLEGVQTLVNLYTAQMGAAKIATEIQTLKLDVFKTQVETYTAQVGAKTAEFGMFESQIRGQMARVQAYDASVRAYGGRVDAYKSVTETKALVVRSQVEAAGLKLEAYKTDIQRYAADLDKANLQMRAVLEKFGGDVKLYSVAMETDLKKADQTINIAKANVDTVQANTKIRGDIVTGMANAMVAKAHAIGAVNAGLASTYGSVGQGALQSASAILADITNS